MKVLKFGGSTIKDPELVANVVGIMKNESEEKVIVMSALHGQTNEIRKYISKLRTEKEEINSFINNIRIRHYEMLKKCVKDEDIQKRVHDILDKLIVKLERLLYGVAYTEELTPRTADLILSSAERMSVYLMEGILLSHGIHSKAFEADKIGIITDANFGNATANLKITEKNLRKSIIPEINNGQIPIITGFFGSDSEGRTCTFGKNGSDYSAAVIANALNASTLELWKDVDGFMSADPSIIDNAYTIDRLSYAEAAELAYFGIGLLHPRTVEPVKSKIIPIVIKNIKKPANKGTLILQMGYESQDIIKSIVYSTELVEIKISAIGAGHRIGVLALITNALNNSNINIYSISTSQTQLSLLIYKEDLDSCLKALKEVSNGYIKNIEFNKDIALVSVVGEGAHKSKGLAAKVFGAVAEVGVNVTIISAGASTVASHFIVKNCELNKTVKALHDTFCNLTGPQDYKKKSE